VSPSAHGWFEPRWRSRRGAGLSGWPTAGAEELCAVVGGLLNGWEPDPECETENDFARNLIDWLDVDSEWEIEVSPSTREGKPDILIGDLLAVELKCHPTKGVLDRALGQFAVHSRQWMTWVVLIDATASEVGRLQDLLADKGLEQIKVWRLA